MNGREIEAILTMHADRFTGPSTLQAGMFKRNVQVKGLLDLAEHLHVLLKPVEPDPDFRRRLHGELILEAQQRQADLGIPTLFQKHRKGIILGAAAAGSAASIAGVVLALVWRHRQGRATHIAAG